MLASPALAQVITPLPPVPVPTENPITESKRVLGKILFWDEQLSTDNTMACGTCHIPSGGGADPRLARNPGPDQLFETPDDVFGSFGVVARDVNGQPVEDPNFGFDPQVTPRAAPKVFMAAYSPGALFQDGRTSGAFVNPETGSIAISGGGTLENVVITAIMSPVEMAHPGRTWAQVRSKLQSAEPLALASTPPADIGNALQAAATYPALFAAAFGSEEITAERIAFAIATYLRTAIPNQTPWDRWLAGDPTAFTAAELRGRATFDAVNSGCRVCHANGRFTTNQFRNLGLRPPAEDLGRFNVTGIDQDRGRFRVPSLRNVGLRDRFMHTGRLQSLEEVVAFYRQVNGPPAFFENRDRALENIVIPESQVADLITFVRNGLTDPRMANEEFPFDRPKLRSELLDGDVNCDGVVTVSDISPFVLILTDAAAYAEQYPTCTARAADMNLDGSVTVGDIGSFVSLLTGA